MDKNMDMEFINIKHNLDIRGFILIIKNKVKENCLIMIIQSHIKEYLKMVCHMEKALLRLKMVLNFKLNGLMELINVYFDFFLLYPQYLSFYSLN